VCRSGNERQRRPSRHFERPTAMRTRMTCLAAAAYSGEVSLRSGPTLATASDE
jgi:hypothetical protein